MIKPALPLGLPRADGHVNVQKSYVQQALVQISCHKISTSDSCTQLIAICFAAVGGSAANGSAVGGGFAATPDAAGNTKKVETISLLSAALVLKDNFIKLLPFASRPFLTPLPSPLYASLPVTSMQKKKQRKRSLIQTMSQALPRNLGSSFKTCLK